MRFQATLLDDRIFNFVRLGYKTWASKKQITMPPLPHLLLTSSVVCLSSPKPTFTLGWKQIQAKHKYLCSLFWDMKHQKILLIYGTCLYKLSTTFNTFATHSYCLEHVKETLSTAWNPIIGPSERINKHIFNNYRLSLQNKHMLVKCTGPCIKRTWKMLECFKQAKFWQEWCTNNKVPNRSEMLSIEAAILKHHLRWSDHVTRMASWRLLQTILYSKLINSK